MTHKIIQSSCHSTYTMLNKLDKMLRKQFVSHHVHCQCHLFYTFEEFWIFKPFRSNSFDRSANARRTFASWDWTSWWGSKYLSRKYCLFPKNNLFLKKTNSRFSTLLAQRTSPWQTPWPPWPPLSAWCGDGTSHFPRKRNIEQNQIFYFFLKKRTPPSPRPPWTAAASPGGTSPLWSADKTPASTVGAKFDKIVLHFSLGIFFKKKSCFSPFQFTSTRVTTVATSSPLTSSRR